MHMLSSPKQRCCAYALAIQRWQYSAGNTALAIQRCPATAPQPRRINPYQSRLNDSYEHIRKAKGTQE